MVVLGLCVAALTAVSMQVRCVDAAREAARLASRGDGGAATVQAAAPAGAVVRTRQEGRFVVATVSVRSRLLPGLTISADAVSMLEPG